MIQSGAIIKKNPLLSEISKLAQLKMRALERFGLHGTGATPPPARDADREDAELRALLGV